MRWRFGEPHEAQRQVLESPHRYVYMRSGLGAGKTWVGVQWCAANVVLHDPGTTGVIISPTYSMLDDVIRPQIEEHWPESVVSTWHGTERAYRWPGGSKVLLRSADRPGRLRGIEIGWAWIDEAAECKEELWPIITGRLRARTRWLHQVLVTGTPCGFNWTHDVFGDPGQKLDEGFHVVQTNTEANLENLPEGYVDSLRSIYSARMAAQELDGSVVHLEGMVFTEFDPDQHVTECDWRHDEPTRLGIDFGYRNPSVTAWRRHPDREAWVCFDEIHPSDTTTEALADLILGKGWSIEAAWCDPAGKAATTAGRSDVDVLRKAGIPAKYRTSSKVRRIAFGLEVMRSALAPADGSPPRLLVHRNLVGGNKRGLYRALLSYRYRGNTETPDKDNVYDHAIDATRYLWANTEGIRRRTASDNLRAKAIPRVIERRYDL